MRSGGVHVHVLERDGDLEGLLAVAHVHGATHANLSREVRAEPAAAFRLHVREELSEPRAAHLLRLADVGQHQLVAEIGREHAPRREHGGDPRHDDAVDLEHARDLGDVEPRRAAEGQEREAARVGAAAHRHEADALGHVGVDHALDAFRGGHGRRAEPLRHRGDGFLRRLRVEARAPPRKLAGSRKPSTTLASVTVAAVPPLP